ncbi:MAG: ATP synthase F0 subunit C [Sedimentisphaerales bacterium]|jgi:F-type H+-transporting ATPase subunit c|nr:ATP synthase F0 subunit C [Sedimentisphaerales bacterium]
MSVIAGSMLAAMETKALGLVAFAVVIGCGLTILGAAFAIGWIGSRAVESISRQPEAGTRIFSAMIIAAALIEGVTFFSLIICFLTLYWMK